MRNKREYEICKAVSQYLRMHPKKPLFHFDQAGANLSKAQAGMMKALNSKRGFPDLFIAYPARIGELADGSHYAHGMFLEIKHEDVKLFKKDGKTFTQPHFEEQNNYHRELHKMGYMACFAVGLDECIRLIDNWLN